MGLTVSGRKNILSTVNHQKCRLKLTILNFTVSAGYNGPSGYWKNQFPCKKKKKTLAKHYKSYKTLQFAYI